MATIPAGATILNSYIRLRHRVLVYATRVTLFRRSSHIGFDARKPKFRAARGEELVTTKTVKYTLCAQLIECRVTYGPHRGLRQLEGPFKCHVVISQATRNTA